MDKKSAIRLLVSILITQGAGLLGSLFTTPKIATWYTTINRPSWNPPNSWFGPVWALLFILMGITLYYLWGEYGTKRRTSQVALYIFSLQLLANIIWSALFFGLQSPALGLAWIIILWILILVTIIKSWPVNKLAALLLLPYLFWVGFATYLNFTIWQLN